MHYVIGDVHGCYDELMLLIGRIEARDPKAEFTLVGDLIDRGPKVMETLDWAMKHVTADGRYQCVLGNHEQMVIDWFEQCVVPFDGLGLGFVQGTRYDFSDQLKKCGMTRAYRIEPFIRFFRNRPLLRGLKVGGKHFVIVHGQYTPDPDPDSPEWLNECLWGRLPHRHDGCVVVHGHTPTVITEMLPQNNRPGMIAYAKNDINLDGGACFFYTVRSEELEQSVCMLGAICLETGEEFYPYTIEEAYERAAARHGWTKEKTRACIDSYRRTYVEPFERWDRSMM